MSNPSSSNTSPLGALHHHHHHHHRHSSQRAVVVAAATTPPPPPPPPTSPSSSAREYRKGNWTLQETLVLITAKRLDDERRYPGGSGGGGGSASGGSGRPVEQRWKWIENYCWKSGCYRSQNQCNDKWDNLLREYKKVRDYESRSAAAVSRDQDHIGTSSGGGGAVDCPSYWTMERLERKERNLPTNLAREVFDALTDVLGRRAARRALPLALLPPPQPLLGTVVTAATAVSVSASPSASTPPSPSLQPAQMSTTPSLLLPSPAATPQAPPPPVATVSQSQPSFSDAAMEVSASSESTDNDNENDEPAPKRRRLRRLGSSVVRSATVLSQTLLACEEKRERRHRELLNLEERRLKLEERRAEQHHQEFLSLVSAVNNLSGAIHALVSDHRNAEPTTGFRSPQVPHRQVGDMSR